MLKKCIFQNFQNRCFKLGTPEIDLFVSPVFHALTVQVNYYAFPPFCLVPCVLSKTWRKQVHSMILVERCWKTQPWIPKILSMLVAKPVVITNSPKLLVDLSRRPHPLVQNNNSGLDGFKEEISRRGYLKNQPNLLTDQKEQKHRRIMNWPEISGLAVVLNGKVIYFKSFKLYPSSWSNIWERVSPIPFSKTPSIMPYIFQNWSKTQNSSKEINGTHLKTNINLCSHVHASAHA